MLRLKLLVAVVLALVVSAGCSAKAYHIATVSVAGAHSTASLVQDQADAWRCGAPTAPATVCLSDEKRREVAAVLSPAFDKIGKSAEFVKAWPVGQPMPPQLAGLLVEITELLNKGLALLPESLQQRIVQMAGGGK